MGKYYVSWKAFVLITDDWGRETILLQSLVSCTCLAGGFLFRFNPQSVSHLYHGTFEAR